MERLPNLFIVGVAKAGTSALFEMLTQHPEIAGSRIKEPHYFTEKIDEEIDADEHKANIQSKAAYLELFNFKRKTKYQCEASPSYFWETETAKKIYDFNPKAKIIVILRHPIERAYSHYEMDLHAGREKSANFLKALKKDLKRKDRRWGTARLYVDLSFYASALHNYQSIFNQNFLVLDHKDFLAEPSKQLDKIWQFLAVTPHQIHNVHVNQTVSYNAYGRRLKSIGIEKYVPVFLKNYFKRHLNTKEKTISQDAIDFLIEIYRDDIKALHSLGYPFYDDIFESNSISKS